MDSMLPTTRPRGMLLRATCAVGRPRRPVGVRLCVADRPARVRRRRTPAGPRARLAPRLAHALAREPWHAGTTGPGVRAAARRLVPRRGLPRAAQARRRRAAAAVVARDAHRGVRPALPALPHPARRSARAGLHAEPAKPELRRRRWPSTSCCTSSSTHAGRFGTTLDYLLETADALRRRGLRDREIERMVELARLHALA